MTATAPAYGHEEYRKAARLAALGFDAEGRRSESGRNLGDT